MSGQLVVLSGGLDSTVCMALADREPDSPPLALTFDYGQRHRNELDHAAGVAYAINGVALVVQGRLAEADSLLQQAERTRLAWLAIWVPPLPGLTGQAVFGYHMVVQRQPPPPLPPWPEALITVSVVYAIASVVLLVRTHGRLTDVNELGSDLAAADRLPASTTRTKIAMAESRSNFHPSVFRNRYYWFWLIPPHFRRV